MGDTLDEVAVRKEMLRILLDMMRKARGGEYDDVRTLAEQIQQKYNNIKQEKKLYPQDIVFIEAKNKIIEACEGDPRFPKENLLSQALAEIGKITDVISSIGYSVGIRKKEETDIVSIKKKALQILEEMFKIATDEKIDPEIQYEKLMDMNVKELGPLHVHIAKLNPPKTVDDFDKARNKIIFIPQINTRKQKEDAKILLEKIKKELS